MHQTARVLRTVPVASIVILLALLAPVAVAQDDVDQLRQELEQTREELNQTREELAEAKEDRDVYATRLEEQTQILIIVLVMLIISYVFFFVSSKRQRIMFEALKEGKLQVEGDVRPKRRRRRG